MTAKNHWTESALLVRTAGQLLDQAKEHELAGRSSDAMECYAAAVDLTSNGAEPRVRAESLRRLGVLHHMRAESEAASDLCRRSREAALESGAPELAAEASNALGGFALERGELEEAGILYHAALQLGQGNPALVGKVTQNLGIIANIRGEWDQALGYYQRALEAYRSISDRRGVAQVHHNLGMIYAKQKRWQDADRQYRSCHGIAEAAGDRHLGGLAALNRAEVRLAIDDLEGARAGAELALRVFNEIESRRDKAGAHRMLGMVFRRRGQMALAESHLRSAVEIAAGAQCPLTEADAAKELAVLCWGQRRADEAVRLLERARTIYQKLEAVADLAQVEAQLGTLRGV